MSEFGTVFGTTQAVRANRLEERLDPLVPFPHRHAFYHLVAITSGSGWHEIDFHRYEVRPGKIFLMKPGQVHSWKLNDKTRGWVVEFEESALPMERHEARILSKILSAPLEHCDLSKMGPDRTERIFSLLELMTKEYVSQELNFEISLRHFLVLLLVELLRVTGSTMPTSTSVDPSLDKFLTLIEAHFQKQHEVEYYANKLSLTSKALTMRSLRTFGKSARKLIHDRLILESKRMLAYSDLSVAEVGYELGFEDPNYFARFFKRNAGLPPGVFRDAQTINS